jgi:hypothetical protein
MNKYIVDAGNKLRVDSYYILVEAKSRKAAVDMVKKYGFSAGTRLSATFKGPYVPKVVEEIKPSSKLGRTKK